MDNSIFMKKLFLIPFLSIAIVANVIGQSVATDFTVTECSGMEYSLFSKLDQGKIVVLAWVMPCFSCIVDPVEAYAITLSYEESNPDMIDFIIVDDYANTSCGSLTSWVEQYAMDNALVIVNSAVSMDDYGVHGMPKIVLLAGLGHQVYYNENSSIQGFQAALDLAISENEGTVGLEDSSVQDYIEITSFPNPTNDFLNVSYYLHQSASVSIRIIDALGAQVLLDIKPGMKSSGKNEVLLNITSLKNGEYFLQISSEKGTTSSQFVVLR
jgi:hypothetical protein